MATDTSQWEAVSGPATGPAGDWVPVEAPKTEGERFGEAAAAALLAPSPARQSYPSAVLNRGVQGLSEGAGSLLKSAGAVQETMPIAPSGYGIPSFAYTGFDSPLYKQQQARYELLGKPAALMKNIRENPLFKAGQNLTEATPKAFPVGIEHRGEVGPGIAHMAGEFAPVVASGPLAPVTIGLQSMGAHLDNDFNQAKAQGLPDDKAAERAFNRAIASGTLQAATFALLPPPLRKAGEKFLIDKFGQGTVEQFLAGRVALGAEGAVLGATSTAAENVASDRPVEQGVGEGATAMGLMQAAMPPYRLPSFPAKPATEPAPAVPPREPLQLERGAIQLPNSPAAPSGPPTTYEGISQLGRQLREQGDLEKMQQKRASQAPGQVIDVESEVQPQPGVATPPEFRLNVMRQALLRSRIDALQNAFEQAKEAGDAPAMKQHQEELLNLQRELYPLEQQQRLLGAVPFGEQGDYPLTGAQMGLRGPIQRPFVPEFGQTKPQPEAPGSVQKIETGKSKGQTFAPTLPELPSVYQPEPGTPLRTKAEIAKAKKEAANALQKQIAGTIPVRETPGNSQAMDEGIPGTEEPAGAQATEAAPPHVSKEVKGEAPMVKDLRTMLDVFDTEGPIFSPLEREVSLNNIERHAKLMDKEGVVVPNDLHSRLTKHLSSRPTEYQETPEQQLNNFFTMTGGELNAPTLKLEGGMLEVRFDEPSNQYKGKVYDKDRKQVDEFTGRYPKTVARKAMEKYGLNFAAAEAGRSSGKPEPLLPPEFRQQSVKRGSEIADQILEGRGLRKKADYEPLFVSMQSEAARLGIEVPDIVGPFERSNYERAAVAFNKAIKKQFGDRPTDEIRGTFQEPTVKLSPVEEIAKQSPGSVDLASLPDDVINDLVKNSPYKNRMHDVGLRYGLSKVYPGIIEAMEKVKTDSALAFKAAFEKDQASSPETKVAAMAAQAKHTWAEGVIEGANRKGPNYDSYLAEVKAGKAPAENVAEHPSAGDVGGEPDPDVEPPFDTRLYSGLGILDKPLTNFMEKDILPLIKKGVDGTKAAYTSIVDLLSPASHTPERLIDTLFESKGYKEKVITQAAAAVEAIKKQFDDMADAEQVQFIDRIKRGEKQATPDLQKAADLIRKWDDKLYAESAVYKPGLPYLENHLRVLWKVIPGSPESMKGLSKEQIASKKPWRGSQGFTKRHVLEDMSEGLAMGGVPVTKNPVEMFLLHAQDVMKFVAANRAWESLKKTGDVTFVRNGGTPPPGYSRIKDSIAQAYFKTEEGVTAKAGEWWVQDGAARMINNYLSRDLIRGNAIGRGLLALKNMTTAMELGMSPFHAIFESNEVMGSQMGLGLAKILSGRPEEGLKDFQEFIVAPKTTSKIGRAAILFAKNADQFKAAEPEAYDWFTKKFPEAKSLIDDLFTGGGQIEMHSDYRVKGIKGFQQAIKEENSVGAVVRAIPALNEVMMKPLFETYIPRLKVGTFLREYAFELERRSDDLKSGKITRNQLARETWSFIEDRFGELNWDNLYWNRTFKSAMQLAFRSVTWKLGNLRGFGKAGRDIGTEVAAGLKGPAGRLLSRFDATAELGEKWASEGRTPRLTMPMAWLVGMSIITAMQATLITKMSTGKMPWELAEDGAEALRNLVFPRIDPVDKSQRVSIPTYWRDAVHLTHSPVDYVKSSMSGEWGRLADVWQNRDFYGTEVYHPDDPELTKIYDGFKHMVPLPFGLSSYIAAHQTGATGGRAAAGFMGFTKAPYYVSYTPAEKQAYQLIREQQPIGSRTREEFERGVQERIAVDAIKRKDMTLSEAVREGLVGKQRVDIVGRRIQQTPLQHAVKSLRADGALKVLLLANPDERKIIEPLVKAKIANSETLTPLEKRDYFQQIRELDQQAVKD